MGWGHAVEVMLWEGVGSQNYSKSSQVGSVLDGQGAPRE